MPSDLYVSLSGMMAMENRVATIAENVANMRTTGFKAETVNFDTVLSSHSQDEVAFPSTGEVSFDLKAGPLEATGNPLDLAISGDAFFGIQMPGGVAYTRDGRFTIDAAGDLLTLTGHAVLDDGGAPMALDPAAGPVSVGLDGTISQGGQNVGVVGLFVIPADAAATRAGDSALRFDAEVQPVVDRIANTVRQGYREGSNVNPILALTELITAQRNYEHSVSATRDREDALDRATREMGTE